MKVTFGGFRCRPPANQRNRRSGGKHRLRDPRSYDYAPIILDLGTGLRSSVRPSPDGASVAPPSSPPSTGPSGLPFFRPLSRWRLSTSYGPTHEEAPGRGFGDFMLRVLPLPLLRAAGRHPISRLLEDDLAIGNAKVRVRPCPTAAPPSYRIDWGRLAVAYSPTTSAPVPRSLRDSVLAVVRRSTCSSPLRHYTRVSRDKAHWFPCTSTPLARRQGGARPPLAIIPPRPSHDDDSSTRCLPGHLPRRAGASPGLAAARA